MAGEAIQMNDFGRTDDDIYDDDIFDDDDDIFDDDDYTYDDAEGDIAETSFSNRRLPDTPLHNPSAIAGDNISNLRERLKKSELAEMKKNLVIKFYNSVESDYGLAIPKKIPYKQFKISRTGKTLYWNPEKGKLLSLMNKKKFGSFLSLGTLVSNYGKNGTRAIQESMELKDYDSKTKKLSPKAQENLEQASANLPEGNRSFERPRSRGFLRQRYRGRLRRRARPCRYGTTPAYF
ncbi:hypothetical protein RRG08_053010 [Elysia crispata]|uniref:Uncharacterized protein n=1 Tax=Elysia crispata TaxID=231223 RepID=A0AAE1E3H6_9GAST|nr:hypothetical protein RRG08_053010 [Elysia crispata]